MTERRFDPDSPAVRRLIRAHLDAIDTVDVRALPGQTLAEYEGLGSNGNLAEPTVRKAGDIFSVPRKDVVRLVQRGIVEHI